MSAPDPGNLQFFIRSDMGLFKDTAGTMPCTTSGDAVALWQDQSQNGYGVVQAGGTNQPAYETNQINSLPSVRFTGGTPTWMNFQNSLITITKTCYAVFKFTGTGVSTIVSGGNKALQWRIDGNASPVRQRLVSAGILDIGFGTTALVPGTWYQANVSGDFTNYVLRVGQASDGTLTVANTGMGGQFRIGDNPANAGESFTGDIAALMIYNTIHSLAMRQSVESYLNGIFGV